MKWAFSLLLLCTNFALVAAPAPLPRPNPRAFKPVGEWLMQWGGANYIVTLDKDGSYSAVVEGGTTRWEGVYKYESSRDKDGVWSVTIDIDEKMAPGDPMVCFSRLSMMLVGDSSGKVWMGRGGAGLNAAPHLDVVLKRR